MSVLRFSCLVFLLGFWAVVRPAAAAPATDSDPGVDLVILVDQSGSMWGYPGYKPGPNDPQNHRIDAARETVLRLLLATHLSPAVHRISVIDFGDDAVVAWSAYELRYDPADSGALQRVTEPLIEQRIQGQEWINTNTPESMFWAARELDKMAGPAPAPASGTTSGRRQVVLLITDGRANLKSVSRDEMRRRVRRQASQLQDRGAELWVIGLNDADDFWKAGDGAFWKDLAGDPSRARLADRAWPELRHVVGSMVDEWLGISSHEIKGDEFEVQPYLRRLVVRATFAKKASRLRVLDPTGLELPRTFGGDTYERYGLDNPPAGLYTLENRLGASVSTELWPPQVERPQPAGSADLEVDNRLVFKVLLAEGKPLEPLAGWPIRARVWVSAEGGSPQELVAEYEGAGKFTATWRPTAAGSYRLRLEGLVELSDGTSVDVFAGSQTAHQQTVEVGRQRPYLLRLEKPRPQGLRLAPWHRQTILRLALVDGDGQRVDIATAVQEPDTWLRAEVLDKSGVPLSESVPLELRGKHFVGRMPVHPDWAGSDGLLALGELNLRVVPAADRLGDDYTLRAIELPKSAEDLRLGSDPMTVGPIALRLSYWLTLIALLPLLVLLAGGVWFLVRRILPNWLIAKRDAARGKRLKLKIFDMLNDPSCISGKSFTVSGAAHFKLDSQVSLTVGAETKLAEHFRVTRLNVPGRPRARLEYRWQGEKKTHKKYLTAGSPHTLHAELAGPGRLMAELSED